MGAATDDYTELANKLLGAIRPATFLCVGSGCEKLARCPHAPPDTLCLPADEALSQLGQLGRFDFALLCDGLERLPKKAGKALLAQLRDLHGGRFAVLLKRGEGLWSDQELLAMGLIRAEHGEHALYLFDIRTYKHTPDWLNPRFWANPERWDKDWW